MNKEQFIELLAQEMKSSKVSAASTVNAILDSLIKCLKDNESLKLIGFGTFKVRKRAARQVRSPRDGEIIKVPAKNYVSFTPGTELKKVVNSNK